MVGVVFLLTPPPLCIEKYLETWNNSMNILHVSFLALTELPAVAEGQSRDQHLSVTFVCARPPQQFLPCCPPTAGPHRQQSAGLQDWSVYVCF